jgi:hypothetical protein
MVGHDEHGTRCLSDHVIGHAAQQQAFHTAVPVSAHDDEVGAALARKSHDLDIRAADDDVRADD